MEVVKKYTDENYIAINDLRSFGDDFIIKTREYRNNFVQMIPINELDYVKIVETPTLIKKRYVKNVELKGLIEIDSAEHDYILELAKFLVNGNKIEGIDQATQKSIIQKYMENEKDLTIVTNYLANNINKIILIDSTTDLETIFPELSKKDLKFLAHANNKNLNYTIQKYQNLTNSSYETGRKSLDKLTDLKLFTKQKIGKKFVYKPTDKLQAIMKGGNNEN